MVRSSPDEAMDAAVAQLVAGARRVADGGLVVASAGNLSVRVGDRVAITGGGVGLDRLTAQSCPIVDLDGRVVHGDVAPSSELALHLAVYAATEAGAVVHTHSHFATVVSTQYDELPVVHYAALSFGGPLRVAPYALFGTAELATNVTRALRDRRGALMSNHGAVAIADDVDAAVERAFLLEWLCSVTYHALPSPPARLLDAQDLAAATEQATRLGYQ